MPVRRPRRKAVLIGLDAAMLEYLDRYVAEGRCPNLGRLLREGASADACSALPPATSVNWNTIATGAYAGGHGVHGMNFRTMGAPLAAATVSSFDARYRTAEALWEANERGGGSNLLLRYTCSWPPTITRGVQVDGHGQPGANLHQVSQRHAWATYPLGLAAESGGPRAAGLAPVSHQVELRAGTWDHAPAEVARTLEAGLPFKLSRGRVDQPLHALLVDYGDGRGFREVRLNVRRDWEGSVAGGEGQWTPYLTLPIRLYPPAHEWDARDGNGPIAARSFFRVKVMELAPDGSRFKLYHAGAFPDTGWTVPEDLCGRLIKEIGPYVEPCGVGGPFRSGWTDVATFIEEQGHQTAWLSAAARYLMPRTDWGLFMAQVHLIDQAGHSFLGHMDPEAAHFLPELREACREGYRRSYELADEYVGAILENVPDDATIMVVSDHGMYPVRLPVVDVNGVLAAAGLYSPDKPAESRAGWFYESQIRVNVRGRDEGGVVAPGAEYEAVRDQVIRALEEYRDEDTGERIFQLVLRSEDAQVFGWYGDRVGDVCFLQKPRLAGKGPGPQGAGGTASLEATAGPPVPLGPVSRGEAEAGGRRAAARTLPANGEHHYYWQAAPRTDGSAPGGRAMFILKAPGVRRGYRRPAPVELVDAAPTLAFVSGIPVPRQAEGRIRHDLFEEELF
jgi:predicted AlkP superfamily phosphohydrolase/phosphomutase